MSIISEHPCLEIIDMVIVKFLQPSFLEQIDPNSSAGWKSLNVDDANHFFSKIVDNYMSQASKFTIKGGDGVYRSLYQIEGSLKGKPGIFEWIVENGGNATHRVFIPGGKVTGILNKW